MHLVASILFLNPPYFQKEYYVITTKDTDTVNLCKWKYTSRLNGNTGGDGMTSELPGSQGKSKA